MEHYQPWHEGLRALSGDRDFQRAYLGVGDSDWSSINNKPLVFPPSAHTHSASDITSGTLSDARLSSAIPRLNAPNVGTLSADSLGTHRFGPGSISTVEISAGNVRSIGSGGSWTQIAGEGIRSSGLLYLDAGASSGIIVRTNAANSNAVQFSADGSSTFYGPMTAGAITATGSINIGANSLVGAYAGIYNDGKWLRGTDDYGPFWISPFNAGFAFSPPASGGAIEATIDFAGRINCETGLNVGSGYYASCVARYYANGTKASVRADNGLEVLTLNGSAAGSLTAGAATFTGAITGSNLSGTNTGDQSLAGLARPSMVGQSGKYLTNNGTVESWGTIDLSDVLLRNMTASGTIGFAQARLQQSAAQTFQTQCYDTSLSAWQETMRQQASPSGAKWSVFGATPILQQTLPAAASDAATTQTLANSIRSLLINFGFSN